MAPEQHPLVLGCNRANLAATSSYTTTVRVMVVKQLATALTLTSTGTVQTALSYPMTNADVTTWNGKTQYAAVHAPPGVNWNYARTIVSNIKFYLLD